MNGNTDPVKISPTLVAIVGDVKFMDDLDSETVLCGPDGDLDSVVLDDIFAKRFSDVLHDLSKMARIEGTSGDLLSQGSPMQEWLDMQAQENETLMSFEDGHGAIKPLYDDDIELGLGLFRLDETGKYKLHALFFDCDLVVDPAYKGLGYGKSLVAASLIYCDGLPTWSHDKPGYSFKGAATIAAGLRLANTLAPRPDLLDDGPC